VKEKLATIQQLNQLAETRGQSLAQMSIAWLLREKVVASVLIGASRVSQLQDNLKALDYLDFTPEELQQIDTILAQSKNH